MQYVKYVKLNGRFPRLRQEMIRGEWTVKRLLHEVQMTPDTFFDRIAGRTDWKLSECKKIRDKVNPGLSLDELFWNDDNDDTLTAHERDG